MGSKPRWKGEKLLTQVPNPLFPDHAWENNPHPPPQKNIRAGPGPTFGSPGGSVTGMQMRQNTIFTQKTGGLCYWDVLLRPSGGSVFLDTAWWEGTGRLFGGGLQPTERRPGRESAGWRCSGRSPRWPVRSPGEARGQYQNIRKRLRETQPFFFKPLS